MHCNPQRHTLSTRQTGLTITHTHTSARLATAQYSSQGAGLRCICYACFLLLHAQASRAAGDRGFRVLKRHLPWLRPCAHGNKHIRSAGAHSKVDSTRCTTLIVQPQTVAHRQKPWPAADTRVLHSGALWVCCTQGHCSQQPPRKLVTRSAAQLNTQKTAAALPTALPDDSSRCC